jgi:subtilisin family serine protease
MFVSCVIAVAFALLALPASTGVGRQLRTAAHNGYDVAAGEALVKLRTTAALPEIENESDADSFEEIGGTGVRRVHSRSLGTDALIATLAAHPDVEYVEPNYILHAVATPNDPGFPNLYGLLNTGQAIQGVAGTPGADIGATSAWDLSTGSRGTVVAVVDTGVDYNHPDLAANVWSAPSSFTVVIGGSTITCAGGTHGFNAIAKTCNPMDDNDHGSHVSGTIGAVGNNGVGVVGVNWTASIMGAKFLDSTGSGTLADAINAIEFAVQAKQVFGTGANVRVLSNSWGGGGFSQSLLDEINRADTNDMLFVAAAGNNGRNNDTTANYPSNYAAPNVVAVAATDNRDQLASFSNFGRGTVHLGAPGVNILSTVRNGAYAYFSGTSMATPHVSGAAALVLSKCTLDTAGLKATLLNAVDPIASLATVTITGGRLNVFRAISNCAAPPTPDFTLTASPASRSVAPGASATYTVTTAALNGFTGTITFGAAGLPAGATATFSPAAAAAGAASTLTVATSSTTPPGSYSIGITAISGGVSHSTGVTLVVANADFTLSVSPSSLSVRHGSSGSFTVTVTSANGFAGTVNLSASGLPQPTQVTATWSATSVTVPAGGSAQARLTLAPASNATRTTYGLRFTGTSGSLSHSASASFRVR